jgi:4-amino-4-deoxy-L-arabinose transferase-like glycosyltransferase
MFGKKKPDTRQRRRSSGAKAVGRGKAKAPSADATLDDFVVEEIEIGDVGGGAAVGPVSRARRTRASTAGMRMVLFWTALCLMIAIASVATRGLWPPVETRFLSIAWEMWTTRDWLHPALNGQTLSAQPPLVLWVVLAGWKVLGVNDWWPRLLPALCALGTLAATQRLARRFWPEETDVQRYAPVVLIGTGLWAFFITLSLAEMAVVLLVVLTALGVESMAATRPFAWLPTGLLIAAGILAAGPVFLVYVGPLALLAPFWCRDDVPKQFRWTPQLLKAVLVAAIPVGAWLAATVHGYDGVYQWLLQPWVQPLPLFGEHGSWWGYLFLIPFVFLPWSVWPLPWMRLWDARSEPTDRGVKFAMLWSLPAILLLSIFSTRQPQMLLPLVPVYSMIIAWLLLREEHAQDGEDGLLAGMAVPALVIGGVLAVLPGLPHISLLPSFLWDLSPMVGVAVAVIGIGLTFLPGARVKERINTIAVTVMFAGVVASFVFGYSFQKRYQLNALAQTMNTLEAKRFPVAVVAPYDGQLHFAGRLYRPFAVVNAKTVASWAASHPDGVLLTYSDGWQPLSSTNQQPLYQAKMGPHTVRLWSADVVSTR